MFHLRSCLIILMTISTRICTIALHENFYCTNQSLTTRNNVINFDISSNRVLHKVISQYQRMIPRLQTVFPCLDSLLIVAVSGCGLEAGKECSAIRVC